MTILPDPSSTVSRTGENPGLPDSPDRTWALTAPDFAAAIAKYPLLLIDFWAPWCGPCRQVGPVLEELAAAPQGRVVIAKVNVDKELELAEKFDVQTIPTLILFKNGVPVERVIGFRNSKELQTLMAPHL
jgi:thioredoxin 1